MANDIITTLHPITDDNTNLYPNIKKENIPDGAVDYSKMDELAVGDIVTTKNKVNDMEIDVNDLKNRVNNLGDGSPKYVGTASQITALTSNVGIAVASDTGYWYYWNGSQYVSSGILYQSTGIQDGSITYKKLNENLVANLLVENPLLDEILITPDTIETKVGLYFAVDDYRPGFTDYQCAQFDVSNCDSIDFTMLSSAGVGWVNYLKVDGTKGNVSTSSGVKHLDLKDIVTLAINFSASYCDTYVIRKSNINLKLDNKLVITKENIAIRQGIYFTIDSFDPSFVDHRGSYVYDCKNLKSVSFKSGGFALGDVHWKDASGNVYQSPQNTSDYLTIDVSNAVQIAFNFGSNLERDFTIEFKEVNDLNMYDNYNNKGLVFDNTKTALFVGDSITWGFTSGGTTTQNNYPKLFSEHYGMTHYNEAVGGAEYCVGGQYTPTMLTQITNSTHKDVNYLFIGGGVNDWQNQRDLHTFKTAVSDVIDYALSNYPNAQIILITPINTTYDEKPITLNKYRNALTETAIIKNNSRITIIQGYKFNFPNKTNDSGYASLVFGDGIHPSELGYSAVYTKGLIDSLE